MFDFWQEHSPATNLPFSPSEYPPYLSTFSAASCLSLLTNCRSQAFAPLFLLCSSYPKYTSVLPWKPCILSMHLLLVHLLLSPLSQPLSQLRSLSQLQPSTTDWELHNNINFHSSPTCLLIQLFFLAFAFSFLAASRSLPVQLHLLFSFNWNLLWFLNILITDISFPYDKRSTEDTRNKTPCAHIILCWKKPGVARHLKSQTPFFSMHMQIDSERFNWPGTVKQKTHYQNYPALNTLVHEHPPVSSATRPAGKCENSIPQRTGTH